METGVKEVELRDLWRRYKVDGDATARERLVVAYSPMVKFVAGRLGAGLPSHVDDADLISYGLMGLIGAIERFEPERGIKFETFAMTRIRGAIIDELRSLDWVPRSVRSRAREIETAPGETRARAAAGADRGRARREARDRRGGTAVLAARDRQLLGLRAGRAVDRLRLLRRPGLAARHDLRPARRRPAGIARQQRGQGPADRRDRLAARARAARRRPLLLREPHPARDRRGARRHRVARLAAAHQGRDAAEDPAPAGLIQAASRAQSLDWLGESRSCRPTAAGATVGRGIRDQPAGAAPAADQLADRDASTPAARPDGRRPHPHPGRAAGLGRRRGRLAQRGAGDGRLGALLVPVGGRRRERAAGAGARQGRPR